ncbi:MAG TPA: flagellar biosynthetic protein FliO [Phycisphaerae bacterium]|nr:flagellar biosynthetic protein FliO [Phycisphaerae bacterium]
MTRYLLMMMLVATPAVACADEPPAGSDAQQGSALPPASNQAAALDAPGQSAHAADRAGVPNVGQRVQPPSPAQAAAPGGDGAPTASTRQLQPETEPASGSQPSSPPFAGEPKPASQTNSQNESAPGSALLRPSHPAPGQAFPAVGSHEPIPWYRNGLLSLALVLAIIGGAAYLVRRLVPSMRMLNGGAIEILGRNHLTPKQSLALVHVGQRVVLVGVSPERINTLCEITSPEEVAELLVQTHGRRSASGRQRATRFDELLDDVADDFEEPDRNLNETVPGRSEALDRAKGRVRGLLSSLEALQERR